MNKLDKKIYDKKRYQKHKNKILEQTKKYYQEHKKYYKEYAKRYWQDNLEEKHKCYNQYYQKNKESVLKHTKEHYQKNKEYYRKYSEQWREDNKEELKESHKQWRRTEAGKASIQKGHFTRRTKEKNAINALTSKEWLDILEEYNYRCAYCGCEFEVENMPTRDHIIPISKGGHNTKENIVPACKSCNSKKGTKIIKEKEILLCL